MAQFRTFAAALFLVAAAAPASAQRTAAAPAKPVQGPTVEGITQYTLANGLRVLLFPDPSRPQTTVNITYLVGSRHEGYGETGMAHLLEHMLFKGTPRHRNIKQELSDHGARANGTTWLDRTNYFQTFPATEENLAWALDLEADRMVNSFVAKKDLETEFSVVRNEFESGENSPFRVLLERTVSTAYLWHNYGNSTIGARSDIENVPIERLQAFYRKYYQPDNAMLVIAGKFDPTKALALVQRFFGPIPRPKRTGATTLFPTYTAEPTQDGERSVTLRRVGDTKNVMAVWHVPAGAHPDYAAVEVLTQVLGDEPSGRLYKALVEPKLATSTGAFAFQLREPGMLAAFAELRKEDDLEAARSAMLAAVARVADSGVTADEVERAKGQLLKNIELRLTNSDQVGIELSEWEAVGDWRMLFVHRDRVRTVTAADVSKAAKAYLVPSNSTVGVFIPTDAPVRAEIPPAPDVAAIVKDYKGNAALAAGEVFEATPANIAARTETTRLPGGLQLALLPKKTRGEAVTASLTLRFGALNDFRGQRAVSSLTAEMLDRGTTRLTRQQIKDEFDRLKARVTIGGSLGSVRVSVTTTRPNLAETMKLVAEVLRSPSFPESEFTQLKQEQVTSLEGQQSEPTSRASFAFQRLLSPYPDDDPRAAPTLEQSIDEIKAVTLAQVQAFHRRFYGADHAQLAVVGDFDAAEIRGLADELFGRWKSSVPFARIPQVYKASTAQDVKIETPDKTNAIFLAGQTLPLREDDPDYGNLMLADYLLGGGFLNSRLATRIREKEGLSYGVGSRIQASPSDSVGAFIAFAIYAPQNLAKLEAAFREEMARAVSQGFTPEEVTKAKQGLMQQRQVERASDQGIAGALADLLFRGKSYAEQAKVDAAIAAASPETVGRALRKFVDPDRLVIVKAGDFAKPAPAPPQP
jgi:zinc protease